MVTNTDVYATSAETPQILDGKVFVKYNIEELEDGMYKYDEDVYTIEEYLKILLSEHSENTELLNIILGVIE